MKKLLFTLFVVCIMLTGCGNNETKNENNNANAVFDAKEYNTIEEMNEAAKTNITSAAVAGKSDEKFIVISGNIAQYTFTCNGENWCVRASKDIENDISGLYYDSIGFEKDTVATYYTDDVYMNRFFYNDTQYVISLDVKDKDIAMSHFDEVCAEFQTNITGVQAGYENSLVEDGDNVIYTIVIHNTDGTSTTMDTIYTFDGDKMTLVTSKAIFETEEAAKEYYDQLIEAGKSADSMELNGTIITSSSSESAEFYSDMTRSQFVEMMQSSLAQ